MENWLQRQIRLAEQEMRAWSHEKRERLMAEARRAKD